MYVALYLRCSNPYFPLAPPSPLHVYVIPGVLLCLASLLLAVFLFWRLSRRREPPDSPVSACHRRRHRHDSASLPSTISPEPDKIEDEWACVVKPLSRPLPIRYHSSFLYTGADESPKSESLSLAEAMGDSHNAEERTVGKACETHREIAEADVLLDAGVVKHVPLAIESHFDNDQYARTTTEKDDSIAREQSESAYIVTGTCVSGKVSSIVRCDENGADEIVGEVVAEYQPLIDNGTGYVSMLNEVSISRPNLRASSIASYRGPYFPPRSPGNLGQPTFFAPPIGDGAGCGVGYLRILGTSPTNVVVGDTRRALDRIFPAPAVNRISPVPTSDLIASDIYVNLVRPRWRFGSDESGSTAISFLSEVSEADTDDEVTVHVEIEMVTVESDLVALEDSGFEPPFEELPVSATDQAGGDVGGVTVET